MALPTLNDYLTEVRDLLHDPNDVYWTSTQKTRYINTAIKQRDGDTGNNRKIIVYALTVGQDTYTLSDLGDITVFDVIGIALRFNGLRIVLYQRALTQLNAEWRQWINSSTNPWAFTRYRDNTFIFAPKPSTAYVTEWDCSVLSPALSGGSSSDTMGNLFAAPVPFYAAYLAKQNERQYPEANYFLAQYHREIKRCQGNRAGMLASAYSTYGR